MAFKLLVVLILIQASKSEEGTHDESELDDNRITLLSNLPFNSDIEVMKNVSYYCYAKFDCTKISCGQFLPSVQWLLPRELREYEFLYGINSSRVQFNRQSTAWLNNNSSFLIRSAMYITEIGLIHNGIYSCSHDSLNSNVDFTVNVKGHDSGQTCHLNDQCISYNCYNEQCRCNQQDQVFISQQNQCFSASKLNTSCKYDEQCSHKIPKGTAKCIDNLCSCQKGYTSVTIPLVGKACLKIASLEESCSHNDQCSISDRNSYCSSKNKCECKDGYHGVDGGRTKICGAIKKCDSSELGFNSNMTQGDCNVNQFCRNNVCLCLSNYVATDAGACKYSYLTEKNEPWYNTYGYYIIGGMSLLLVILLIMIAFQVIKYLRERNSLQQSRANSRDPLNRNITHL